jgi:hypothetical protein
MTRALSMLLVLVPTMAACGSRESGREQYLEFDGFTVEEGVYKAKPGWTFSEGEGGTIILARANNPGVVITPCECSLETGGSCDQAHSEDAGGNIREIWCVDNGCGFCVGGVAEPDDPSSRVRFNVVCIENRSAARE